MKKIKYVISIIFILAGFEAMLKTSFFAGLCMLTLGIVLIPNVSIKLSESIQIWNKKIVRYVIYISLFLLSAGAVNNQTKGEKRDLKSTKDFATEASQVESPKYKTCNYAGEKSYIIPDMIAADIYPNFQNKGFLIDKQIKNDHTSIYCDLNSSKQKFTVVITGCSPEEIIAIEATATDYSGNNEKSIEEFLGYVATLQYKNSEPEKAKQWLINNIDKNGAITIIEGVTFTLNFKNKYSKFLRIEIK